MTDPNHDTVGRVTIVGLGPGGPQYITQATLDAISDHSHRFIRTTRHPSASLVGVAISFDDVYEAADTFADVYAEITERRAANMRLFAAELRATGELRPDLTDGEVGDIVWAMNSADYYALLVDHRGWTPERYGGHLADAWRRMLLAGAPQRSASSP